MPVRSKVTRESLKELCIAHMQAVQASREHSKKNDISPILLEMFDQKIRELETQITANLKTWLGCEKG